MAFLLAAATVVLGVVVHRSWYTVRPRRERSRSPWNACWGHASAARRLDRYGHLLPAQAESVAERLDLSARAAEPTLTAPVSRWSGASAGP